ncbi:MAG TPA: biotin--[acetyl-CoA-carboxylase] ligase [Stellaceae bacterium]|nr:biotin--[acetyl-CoA-carboxylase] ligase [Stellaceae bacterium]
MSETVPSLPEAFHLHCYDAVGSTNDEAKALARAGAPEGTLVWARTQTAGRGRRGRAWLSPPGNLYLSLVVRPDMPPPAAAQLGFVAALGLVDGLAALAGPALQLRCKWPNDVLINGRKLAGILLESETSAGLPVDFVVIGVGVNILSAPRGVEYPATSLAAEGIAGITPALLLEAFVRRFDGWARRWHSDGFAPVRRGWLERASGLGELVHVRLERSALSGRFLDLDDDGALLIDSADGRRRIAAGEIFPAM